MMTDILVFIVKWFLVLPIYIGIMIMPFYLLGAFIYAICKDFKRNLRDSADSSRNRE